MAVDISAIYQSTLEHFNQARNNIRNTTVMFEHSAAAISDVIPGFEADKLEFGSYDKENYAVLFVDMRRSTMRAQQVGPEKTFLTMHVFLTALLEVVKHYQGKVIDIMGDGLMVFWGGKAAREKDNMVKTLAVQNAGLCGRDMVALHWEKYMEHIVQKYNKIYRIQMPKVTPHVCRHTFCSNMAKSGMNPKTLQYIMGHADISVTLNTYTHVKFDDAKDELLRVANA